MEGFHDLAFRPFRRFADFAGRSTRSELVAFYLFAVLVRLVLAMVATPLSLEVHFWIDEAWLALLVLPMSALAVRRLHDSGRSGWWALLAIPAVALQVWRNYLFSQGAWDLDLTLAPRLIAAASGLAFLVLVLWRGDPELNPYGPNPRFDDPQGLA